MQNSTPNTEMLNYNYLYPSSNPSPPPLCSSFC